jgi:hypothetical protein
VPFFHPGERVPEVEYLHERRKALGGYLPQRRRKSTETLTAPKLEVFDRLLKSSGDREISTTMAFVQSAEHHPARQAGRPALRADRRRRSAHLRHGRHVPPARHLRPARPEVQAGRPRPADVLPRRRRRPGAGGRHHRSGAFSSAGWPRPRATAPTTCRCCRSTSTTRCSASSASATAPGRRRTCARAASCSAPPPAAPRSTAKACSTKTATRICSRARSRTAAATTRPSATKSP